MSLLSSPLVFVAAGVSLHHALFIHGEWHQAGAAIVAGHSIAAVSCTFLATFSAQQVSLWKLAGNAILYLVVLLTSIAAYRMFFHRLKPFPGPLGARLSKLWHVYENKDSRNHLLLCGLQKRYGDVFRLGPNEVVVIHPDAHNIIDGPGSRCQKGDWYDVIQPSESVLFTRDEEMHNVRRNMWLRGLNAKAMNDYEPRILRHLSILESVVQREATAGRIIEFNQLAYRFSFDSMGDFAFAKDFGLLKTFKSAEQAKDANSSSEWHFAVSLMQSATEMLGPLNPATWIVHLGNAFFPFVKQIKDFDRLLRFCHEQIHERMLTEVEQPDMASWLIEEASKNGMRPTDMRWLQGDSIAVIVAGSETTAASLVFLLYCLVTHEESMNKLFEEVSGVDVHDLKALASLPHLNACINESQRLWPAHPTFHPRQTPKEGVRIGETWIPGGVNISSPRYLLGRMESCWKDATSYVPERWYSKPDMIRNRSAFVPFSVGNRSCSGKLIALAELRSVAASLIKQYKVEVAHKGAAEDVVEGMKDLGTVRPGPLRLKFVPR